MQEKPLHFYMANLWSEVEKIFIWKERGDEKALSSALARALPIIEKVKSSGNESARAEMSILENVLVGIKDSKEMPVIPRSQVSAYLRPFAVRLLGV